MSEQKSRYPRQQDRAEPTDCHEQIVQKIATPIKNTKAGHAAALMTIVMYGPVIVVGGAAELSIQAALYHPAVVMTWLTVLFSWIAVWMIAKISIEAA